MYDPHKPPATLESLEAEIGQLRSEVKDLLVAWNTGIGLVKFVKWSAGLGAAIFAFVAAIKGWWTS